MMKTPSIRTLQTLAIAFACALLVQGHDAVADTLPETVPFSEIIAPICPAEWDEYVDVAQDQVEDFDPFHIHPGWSEEMRTEVGKFFVSAQLIFTHLPVLMIVRQIASSDQAWQASTADYNRTQWRQDAAWSSLVACVIPNLEIDRALVFSAAQIAYPEDDVERLSEQLEQAHAARDRLICMGELEAARLVLLWT